MTYHTGSSWLRRSACNFIRVIRAINQTNWRQRQILLRASVNRKICSAFQVDGVQSLLSGFSTHDAVGGRHIG